MVSSSAKTVPEYLAQLTPEARETLSAVRDVILRNLPTGYAEVMNWGMITYEVPLERYPNTYNKKPLMYAALAAQKNHYALYLSTIYQESQEEIRLREGFAAAGKRLDLGKSCIRFRNLGQLALDVIGNYIASVSVDKFIAQYESARKRGKSSG